MDLLNASPHARSVLLGDRQCTTMNREGNRCGRASALGQFVCDLHGAKSPLSIQAGKERMATLVEPALEVLYRATCNAPPCEVCGRSDADRDPTAVHAGRDDPGPLWLPPNSRDPAGAPARVPSTGSPYLTDAECEALGEMIDRAKQRMNAGVLPDAHAEPLQLDSAVVDADVVSGVVATDNAPDAAHDDEVEI